MTTTFDQEAQAYAWVHEHMPREEAHALAQFTAINPHLRGIPWWDALSMLRDCDAHLDVLEPTAEVVKEYGGGEWTTLHTFVTYTLIYASRVFNEWTPLQRSAAVLSTIDLNHNIFVKPDNGGAS